MKNRIILGLLSLAMTVSLAGAASLNQVLVTTNQLIIPYSGTYATSHQIKLGTNNLPWQQAGKGSNIVATLPANLPSGTYTLTLQGSSPMDVAIGSVNAEAALNARVDGETARAQTAEVGLTNGLNAEVTRATAAEAGLSNSISTETTRAINAEADLANLINAVSNSLAASFNDRLNAVSNNIVTSLTKNFTTAFAFGVQVVSNNVSIPFSSYIGDWTTNGTTFKVPATGVYLMSFTINLSINTADFSYGLPAIRIIDSNDSGTNEIAVFTYSGYDIHTTSGQTAVQCLQGDQISVVNTGGPFTYGNSWPTNVPSATLSIIQIQ